MKRTLLSLLVVLLLAACGSKQDRPAVVAVYPLPGVSLPYLLREMRVVYDRPVGPLNTNSIALSVNGASVSVRSVFDQDDPRIVTFYPASGIAFPAGEVVFTLSPGFEVDQDGHYRLENYILEFEHGIGLPVFLAMPTPPSVVWLGAERFTPLGSLATPDDRTPIGLIGTASSAIQRMWVQLADGGGDGRALAYFVPGDAGMTEVTLSRTGAGDLLASAPALGVSPDGTTLYAAWRDSAAGGVRVHAVDAVTGFELDTVLLSPATGADTRPLGLVVSADGAWVDVTCTAPDTDRLVRIDTATFEEQDLGPDAGVDGLPLIAGAGPMVRSGALRAIGPRFASTADLSVAAPEGPAVEEAPADIPGATHALLSTPDDVWVLQGLDGYAAEDAVVVRPSNALTASLAIAISGDPGVARPFPTAVRALTNWPGLSRVLVLLDNETAAVMVISGSGWFQEDFDLDQEGIQAADLLTVAPGATYAAFPAASFAPDP